MSEADKERDRIVAMLQAASAQRASTAERYRESGLFNAATSQLDAANSLLSASKAIARNEHRSADNGE